MIVLPIAMVRLNDNNKNSSTYIPLLRLKSIGKLKPNIIYLTTFMITVYFDLYVDSLGFGYGMFYLYPVRAYNALPPVRNSMNSTTSTINDYLFVYHCLLCYSVKSS